MGGHVSRVKEGSAEKHGAIWDGKGTNFTVFSAHATLQSAIASVTPAAVLAEQHRKMAEPGSAKN